MLQASYATSEAVSESRISYPGRFTYQSARCVIHLLIEHSHLVERVQHFLEDSQRFNINRDND